MDVIKLGSGDNNIAEVIVLKGIEHLKSDDDQDHKDTLNHEIEQKTEVNEVLDKDEITPQTIDDNESKLKERIAQCRNIIESLKHELNEEKTKMDKQTKPTNQHPVEIPSRSTATRYVPTTTNSLLENLAYTTGIYSDYVESKLSCDENLIEYEKQLQKYQDTLNMAQIEKKNAIRKQMLAKAYRLKLLEVENQCNIELLRVKQSLQCLEPLQMIANKWKTTPEDNFDTNKYDLIPRYPELRASSNCDFSLGGGELDNTSPFENGLIAKDDFVSPD